MLGVLLEVLMDELESPLPPATDPYLARAADLNAFAREKHPGLVGVELLRCAPDEVTGRFTVTDELVAGTGFLWAPVVVTLADWLCAAGAPLHFRAGAQSFTTIELKANFLGTARTGERVFGRATPVHVGGTTQVWDVEVTNEDAGRRIALFRCTQLVMYPRPPRS
jgi:1,4-dihydroxy-2-naphthoyl-CoA hydrolase